MKKVKSKVIKSDFDINIRKSNKSTGQKRGDKTRFLGEDIDEAIELDELERNMMR